MRAAKACAFGLVLAGFFTLSPETALGQFRGELRGGAAVGSHSGTAAGLDIAPRVSYGVLVLRGMRPGISLLGGFLHTAFGCNEGFCVERGLTVAGTHGALGVELRRAGPWLRLALLYGKTEVGNDGEPPDAGFGISAGAGLTIGSGRVLFLPGVGYRWLSANTPSSSDHAAAMVLDLGLQFRHGS